MIIASIADLHFRGKDLAAAVDSFRACLASAVRNGATILTIAGDVFDAPNIGDAHASTGEILSAFVACIEDGYAMAPNGLSIVAVAGNHDYHGPGQIPSIAAIVSTEWTANVVAVREDDIYNGCSIGFVPWSYTSTPEEDIIAVAQDGPLDLLVGHFQVEGLKMSRHRVHDHADAEDDDDDVEPAERTPRNRYSISRERLVELCERHQIKRLSLGDFHARQEIAPGLGGYEGALRQLNRGEAGNPTGYTLYNTETGVARFVEVNAAPKYTVVDVNADPRALPAAPNRGYSFFRCAPGYTPSPRVAADAESEGWTIIPSKPPRLVRVARVGDTDAPMDAAALDDAGLIRLWCERQEPRIPEDRIARLIALASA